MYQVSVAVPPLSPPHAASTAGARSVAAATRRAARTPRDAPTTGKFPELTRISHTVTRVAVRLQLVPRGEPPDLLDLPWSTPLAEWSTPRLVRMARGTSRHVV